MATPIGSNRARLDARAAAEATRGRAVRLTPGREAVGVTTDSRAVTPGCAFVALRGETHDGHGFLPAAMDAGAILVVAERGRAPVDARADAVEVDDTLVAWGRLASAHLQGWRAARPDACVVAITGSAGKTTTKELCAALLRAVAPCLASAGNLNNRVGMPAVAMQVEPEHRFAVLEMGMSVPGEIAALAAIAPPDVAVITNVGLAHAGGVGGTLEAVAAEKGALFAGVRPGGVIVANADDAAVMTQTRRAPAGVRVATFGRAEGAHYRLRERQPLGASGSRVVVERPGQPALVTTLPIPGEAAAIDMVAAIAAAEAATGRALAVEAALAGLPPIEGRMRVRLAGDVQVIDDAYNANPASMRAALAALAEMDGARRVAVLGEMKELGSVAEREHEALGTAVAQAGVKLLVSCGGLADAIARVAAAAGVEVVRTASAEEAARTTAERVRPRDVVLVKASRSVGAERVVEALVRREPARRGPGEVA
ncbi:MAG TPA: UDP-N-acetylmuramoyl-tripeptide--D-alanyl-D-alanine ligase [Polyangiaceae bacterium]|nr:UDP-N-acetylmuramoyl-tripeptide--D-alanyl-D-alanine ligase [Polyangiaceae bacterium]